MTRWASGPSWKESKWDEGTWHSQLSGWHDLYDDNDDDDDDVSMYLVVHLSRTRLRSNLIYYCRYRIPGQTRIFEGLLIMIIIIMMMMNDDDHDVDDDCHDVDDDDNDNDDGIDVEVGEDKCAHTCLRGSRRCNYCWKQQAF